MRFISNFAEAVPGLSLEILKSVHPTNISALKAIVFNVYLVKRRFNPHELNI